MVIVGCLAGAGALTLVVLGIWIMIWRKRRQRAQCIKVQEADPDRVSVFPTQRTPPPDLPSSVQLPPHPPRSKGQIQYSDNAPPVTVDRDTTSDDQNLVVVSGTRLDTTEREVRALRHLVLELHAARRSSDTADPPRHDMESLPPAYAPGSDASLVS